MKSLIKLSAGVLLALGSLVSAQAQAPASNDHVAHHPGQAAATPPATAGAPNLPNAAMMQNMDAHMQAMREMHENMNAAKTQEARQALMDEHMKTMQGGIQMMGMMHGQAAASPPAGMAGMQHHHQMMEKRMAMMESMMKMMMDRLPPTPPGSSSIK